MGPARVARQPSRRYAPRYRACTAHAQLMRGQFLKLFDFFMPSVAKKFEPEFDALVHLMIYRLSVYAKDATYGQGLLSLKYADARRLREDDASPLRTAMPIAASAATMGASAGLTKWQKVLYGLAYIGGKWAWTRVNDISSYWQWSEREENDPLKRLWRLKENLDKLYKFLTVLNTILFLRDGRFPFLIDRILRIRQVYSTGSLSRQVSYEFMNRQLLWHGFAEFLLFLLPLINLQKIKNVALRILYFTTSMQQQQREQRLQKQLHQKGQQLDPKAALEIQRQQRLRDFEGPCGICGESPIGTPSVVPCGHVYCYVCIASNCLADSGYRCLRCNAPVDNKFERFVPPSPPASPSSSLARHVA
ncbi:hypothetical protein CAOG_03311 [Capsaspora owczarzaki ATCC 30864]|uniref:RING-type E3 ubiquitin transferase (cysteine targeting) n=1 Tax=Capsaspora owczarzaki (strain ATCC 30864) TaxID=595528 RepID=A0A0D2VPC7_CAPO3|nr:hypothetical protein CAOG_03311 [Capsaspora owczarzaki ATCC 30864]KJE92312.1 hypothetical protein CAOG_003311 [Capsaspora owczarzaki ATCC 30864]|eukprot:XP_004364150.2 hypothetical protein CAOG_03311 [Capsaspora owczarzaki ATCC 30864]